MQLRSARFALLLAFCAAGSAHGLFAADRDPAITDPREADEDFAFQGEYAGWFAAPSACPENAGLQVAAQGKGAFRGLFYVGGLPGCGWNGTEPKLLSGQRDGRVLILEARPLVIRIYGGRAEVFWSEAGEPSGWLTRVERISPTLGAPPPPGAVVLFDGTPPTLLNNARLTREHWLMVGADTKQAYRDFRLHVEFRLPYMPTARGQRRANSGVYLQSRYEVQILDSFAELPTHNGAGALYRLRPPDVNMSLPPLQWQTYDIVFRAPRYNENGEKIANARISVWHNGVLIHDNVDVPRKTGAGKPEGPNPLPTRFQNHGNPVVFRNLWLVELPEAKSDDASPSCDSDTAAADCRRPGRIRSRCRRFAQLLGRRRCRRCRY